MNYIHCAHLHNQSNNLHHFGVLLLVTERQMVSNVMIVAMMVVPVDPCFITCYNIFLRNVHYFLHIQASQK